MPGPNASSNNAVVGSGTSTLSIANWVPPAEQSGFLTPPKEMNRSGYALLQEMTLGSGTWTASPAAVNAVGDEYQAVVSPSGGAQFYRLVLQSVEP